MRWNFTKYLWTLKEKLLEIDKRRVYTIIYYLEHLGTSELHHHKFYDFNNNVQNKKRLNLVHQNSMGL